MDDTTQGVKAPNRGTNGARATARNAARRRVLRHLDDWSKMPADTFDDASIAHSVISRAADIARRAGVVLTVQREQQ